MGIRGIRRRQLFQRMLRNPYYKGDIIYQGARHLGTHDRLVHPTVWTKVQNVLDAHNVAGDRTKTHEHYLKGSLYCGCGARMTINNARNRHGETYPYFICLARHANTTDCERQAVPTRSPCPCSRRSSTASTRCSPTSTSASTPTGPGARTPSSASAPTYHLATNAHAFYLACDEGRRRLCNQAFFTKITLTEDLDVHSEFTGIYETIFDPANRLHAEFWQRSGQLHPDIDLAHNEATLPTDHGGRVGTSTKWWIQGCPGSRHRRQLIRDT